LHEQVKYVDYRRTPALPESKQQRINYHGDNDLPEKTDVQEKNTIRLSTFNFFGGGKPNGHGK